MARGLIDSGNWYRTSGANMIGAAGEMEQQREAINKRIGQQKKAGTISAAGTGAGIGYMIGSVASVGGPWGAVIGAGVGLLADSLF